MKKKLTELILCAALLGGIMAAVFWFPQGALRIILLAVLYFVEMELIVSMLRPAPDGRKLTPEEKIKAEDQWYSDRQDPQIMHRMRRVGTLMHVIGLVLMVLGMIWGTADPLWGMLGMGCSLACVALCIIHPAYFALFHVEKRKNREYHFPIVNLIVPYIFPLFGCAMQFQFDRAITDWVRVVEAMLLVGAVMGVVLRLLTAECRRNTENWVVMLILSCVCAFGFVMPLNDLLEQEEPVVVSGVVMDFDRGGQRSPSTYEVLLDSGETVDIPMNRHFWDEGDQVELEYHRGGLGIEYYTHAD